MPTPVSSLQETKPSVPLKAANPRETLGDSGTSGIRGIITEEYNSQLQGIQGIKIFDEMRKSDGTVRSAVLVCTLPIRQAEWIVKPGTDDDQGKEVAEFVKQALFECIEDTNWDDIVRQALLMVPFGVMVFEKVYDVKEIDGKSWVVLKKLAPRMPKSIQQWELKDGTFGIQQIRQDGVLAQIPGSKLMIFVNEREGDNWWGTSMIRAAYKHWYYKNNFYKIDAVAFERQGLGVPYVKMPASYTADDELKAKTAMQNLRANEEAFMLIPNGYDAGFMDMGSNTTRDPQNSITHHNREITKSVLAQFLELGAATGSGSRAVSEDQSDIFLNALMAIAKTIASEFNTDLIPELVNLNFNGITKYPKLEAVGLERIDVTALSNAYTSLKNVGAITPTEDDEQYMRAALKLPERTQEQIEKARTGKEAVVTQPDPNAGADGEDPEDNMDPEDPAAKPPTDIPAKKKASEHIARRQKRVFDADGFTSWRPLTFAEQKVNWNQIQKTIDQMQDSFTAQAKAELQKSKGDFMTKVQDALDKGDAEALTALEVNFVAEYKAILKEAMKKAYEYGKVNVSTEMGVSIPANVADTMKAMDLSADTIAWKTATDVETVAKHSAATALKKGLPVQDAIDAIGSVVDQTISKSIDDAAAVLVAQNVNQGRSDVFDRNMGMIKALQRSEILDKDTCDFCLSVDGRVVSLDDSFAQTDIYHSNCRGIWVEILNDEENAPEPEAVPQSILDHWGGEVNSVLQPKKPIVDKGSPAAAQAKKNQS